MWLTKTDIESIGGLPGSRIHVSVAEGATREGVMREMAKVMHRLNSSDYDIVHSPPVTGKPKRSF